MNIKDLNNTDNIAGIYKINFPNGKVYIGLSKNIKRRLKEHLYGNKNTVCEKAMKKYFSNIEDIDFEILESMDAKFIDYEKLSDLEKYWISYYDSTNREKGYNIAKGGLINFEKGDLMWKKFSLDQILKIYEMLKDDKKYPFIHQIAKEMHTNRNVIAKINSGEYYSIENIQYPIRDTFKKHTVGFLNGQAISEETLFKITDLIINSNKNFKEIAILTNVSPSLISHINKGDREYYKIENFTYPLRETHTAHSTTISEQQLDEIIKELKKNELPMTTIGEKFNLSRETIARINKGTVLKYRKNSESYPIRQPFDYRKKKPVSTISGSGE